ncbi:DUF6351 family protein [Microbacterium lacus]|uniref:DUF6351 family protein n=1 Tax=Microbacterium lacus TaxID=415217 RepID=UPI00384A6622
MFRSGARRWALCTTAAAAVVVGLMAPPAATAASDAQIEVLSGRADMISAGDALVKVTGLKNHDRILAAGVDVTDSFQPHGDGVVGLVEDLPLGESRLVVQAVSGNEQTGLDVVNHPRSGPVFSGPQHKLYCQATGLGVLDENCMTDEVVVQYRYRTTGNQFANYPTDGSVPANLASTTVDGVEVPYIFRLERGTINRSLYQIAILHEPGTPEPTPWSDTAAWNDKLLYTFGGACGVGLGQGNGTGGVENDQLLRAGYAVASGSLNVYATNCDDVTSAETAYMVKEHFTETYGVPRFTMGFGGSAGTMQQYLLSNAYPGILDGVIGQIGYPDERTTTATGHDCRGLMNYWSSPAGAGWTEAEKVALSGHAISGTCFGYGFFDGVDDPTRGCPGVVPVADRWSVGNPDGIRCTIADTVTNVYGTDDEGRGLRVIPDNVGVQYGLLAFQSGALSAEKFLSVNANVGGMSIDGARTPARSEASVEAIERGFETGRFNLTTGGLTHIPVIEYRGYTDPSGDFHDSYRSAVLRERMLNAHGEAGTHVSWRGVSTANGTMGALALEKMDEWLTNLEAMGAAGEENREATITARPGDIEDGCFTAPDTFVAAPLDWYASADENPCNAAFPFHADPRIKAGSPLSVDVLKCELTAPVRGDYPALTDEQWTQLNAIFASGVCDYSQPSQGYAELEGTWLSFGADETVALDKPVITGTPRVGDTLAVQVSAAEGAALSYQWMVDGISIAGATGPTFVLTSDYRLATVTVRVTAELDGTVPMSLVSDPSKKVREDRKGGKP